MSNTDNIVVFVDSIGRTVIGQDSGNSTKTQLRVNNPAIVNVNVDESGQIAVQLFPFMFREFIVPDPGVDVPVNEWSFNKTTIAECTNIQLDSRLTTQYTKIFLEAPEVAAEQQSAEPEVVQLFDDEPAASTTEGEPEPAT